MSHTFRLLGAIQACGEHAVRGHASPAGHTDDAFVIGHRRHPLGRIAPIAGPVRIVVPIRQIQITGFRRPAGGIEEVPVATTVAPPFLGAVRAELQVANPEAAGVGGEADGLPFRLRVKLVPHGAQVPVAVMIPVRRVFGLPPDPGLRREHKLHTLDRAGEHVLVLDPDLLCVLLNPEVVKFDLERGIRADLQIAVLVNLDVVGIAACPIRFHAPVLIRRIIRLGGPRAALEAVLSALRHRVVRGSPPVGGLVRVALSQGRSCPEGDGHGDRCR